MKVFLDTDILLDVVLRREPYWRDSAAVLDACEDGKVEGSTSVLVLANIGYIVERAESAAKARDAITTLRSFLRVCSLTDRELGEALVSDFGDLEDAMQHFICVREGIGTIVTRNVPDYRRSDRTIVTPPELLRRSPWAKDCRQ